MSASFPPVVRSFATRHIGRRVLVYEVTDSTNDRAAQLAADPANAGVAVLARSQTKGRGQHGRSWQSPPGQSVLLSVLLFPPPALCRAALLTAWAAVAVGQTIQRTIGLPARIKWPNDLLLGGDKVCGILIESRVPGWAGSEPAGPVVVGIGLNVNQSRPDFEQMGLPAATSLAMAGGTDIDVDGVADQLLRQLDDEYARLAQGDFATLEACWKGHIGLLGHSVTATCTDGTAFHGRLREMTFSGLELVQADGSIRRVAPEAIRHLQ